MKHQRRVLFHSPGVYFFFPPLAFLPPFPLFDVLCPDHLHMEAKGDTGGLIHRQRHAKAIWAQNQTQGFLRLLYERRNGAGGGGRMERGRWKVKRERERETGEKRGGDRKVGGAGGAKEGGGFGTRTRLH